MALHPEFPSSPYAVLDPANSWLQAALLGHLELQVEIDRLRELGFYVAQSLEADLPARYEQSK